MYVYTYISLETIAVHPSIAIN